ncbi:MAG: hypothetical protein PHE47_08755 [Oscillospiraceae bacterium]|nr:hypothetical protein [Oscillospiraceae bacterium]
MEFERFSKLAEDFLNFATKEKIQGEDPVPRKAKMAVCAVADELARCKNADGILTEKAGAYSVTYRDGTPCANLYQTAAVYLGELLFRGWGRC